MSPHRRLTGRNAFLLLSISLGAAPVFAQDPSLAPVPPPPTSPGTAPSMAAPGMAAPGAPAGKVDPQAMALLDNVAKRYRGLKSYQTLMETTGNGEATAKELVQYLSSGSVKFVDYDAQGKPALTQMFLGGKVTILQKNNGVWEYINDSLPPLQAGQTLRAQLADLRIGGRYFSSFLAGVNPLSAQPGPESLTMGASSKIDGNDVNTVIAKMPVQRPAGAEVLVTFSIGKADSLLYGVKTDVKIPDNPAISMVQTFRNIKADIAFPADVFKFTPPVGAKKVANFSPPQMKAKVGQMPLAFTGKDLAGKPLTLSQYKGKVVLVDFWATWCGPCVGELPNVKAAYNKYHAKGFDVVGISLDQDQASLKEFIKEKNMPWRQVWDGYWNGPIATAFNVKAIPATLLIDRQGKIVAIDARGEGLEPAIVKALAAK